ncbi:MAG: hypothetical protein BZ138_07380 [Methanosphaera sp. rholeuAM270]|nr:MAG: hypothetical protein BZ138_07380 [Methanosphaera sp. rholeuAM270]
MTDEIQQEEENPLLALLRQQLAITQPQNTYTDTQLNTLLQTATHTIPAELRTPQTHEEYTKNYYGDTYITQYYPLVDDTLTCYIDNIPLTEDRIEYTSSNGVIYFNEQILGNLTVHYTSQTPLDDVQEAILQIAVHQARTRADNSAIPAGVNSVTEGDVSVTYKNNNNGSGEGKTAIEKIIDELRNRYARVSII